MEELIKCDGVINNHNDKHNNRKCGRTLAKRIDKDIIELKCPICKKKKIIKK